MQWLCTLGERKKNKNSLFFLINSTMHQKVYLRNFDLQFWVKLYELRGLLLHGLFLLALTKKINF